MAPKKSAATRKPKATSSKSKPKTGSSRTKGAGGRKKPAAGKGRKRVTQQQAKTRAERIVRDPEAIAKIAGDAENKAKTTRSKHLRAVLDEVKALIRLTQAYAKGDYRAIPFESMVLVVAALIYVVSPIDLIPDFLPGGYIDDAGVVVWTISMIRDEIDDFRRWEDRQTER